MTSKALGVIPARWASTRYPGKLLADLVGKPLIQHTYEAAVRAHQLDKVVVATDDERIADKVHGFGGETVFTGTCASGTDRVCEAIAKMPTSAEYEFVVNVQGDEPRLDPRHIDDAVVTLRAEPSAVMSTLAAPIECPQLLHDPDVVKCVCDAHGNALYFSRACVPWPAAHAQVEARPHYREHVEATDQAGTSTKLLNAANTAPLQHRHLRHIGLYAFRREFLLRFPDLPPCALEQVEMLEQLRVLHAGFRIQVVVVSGAAPGIDTPEQMEAMRRDMLHHSNEL